MKELIPAKLDKKTGAGKGVHNKNKQKLKDIGGGYCEYHNFQVLQGNFSGLRQCCDRVICLGNASERDPDSQSNKVYSAEGIMTALIAGTHGYANGYILEIR